MNIWITTFTYYPNNDGVQNVTQYIAEGLVQKGHNITVITGAYSDVLEKNGVNIIHFNIYNKYHFHSGDKKIYCDFIKSNQHNVDLIVNVCTQNIFTDLCWKVFDSIKCKKILYMHGMYDFRIPSQITYKDLFIKGIYNIKWKLYYTFCKKYIKQYNCVVQIDENDFATQYFKQHFNICSKIVNNAVQPAFFNVYKQNIGYKYLICVSNYLKNKNQEFILRAFYKSSIDRDISLIFIGNVKTEYYQNLLQINKQLGLLFGYRKVRFLVGVKRDRISLYVGNADIFLFSSKSEKCPICIMEAMAAGVPYISTDVGCVKYNPGGYIIDSVDEMKKRIEELEQNFQRRKSMGEEGAEYARQNFSVQNSVDKFNDIINFNTN